MCFSVFVVQNMYNHKKFFNGSTFQVIWKETMHAKSLYHVACCVRGYHAAVDEPLLLLLLLACKREPNNSLGTYCGSKDR